MERPTDELVQRLLAAVAAGAGGDAARVVDLALAEAEAEVKDLVKSAMKAVLLRRVVGHLEQVQQRGAESPDGPPVESPLSDPTRFPPEASAEPDPPARDDSASEGFVADDPAPPDATPAAPAPTAPAPAEATIVDTPLASYVYAITRTSWGTPPPDLRGVDGRSRLRTVRVDDLQAVVSTVSLAEFGPAVLEDRLKDLKWVEEKVRAHDAIVKALSAAGTIIPCRFCTIVTGEEEARAAASQHRDAVMRTLDRIEGKTEWGVKLLADTRASAAAPAEQTDPAGDAGRAYLMQKKRTGRQREDAVRAAAEAAEACHRQLFALSADAAILPTRDRGGSARGWHLALNAAYLVPTGDTEAFHARVAELARQYRPQGLRIDLTGPWPPYNFSALNLSGANAT